jgi:hypothetical protein
LQDAPSLKWLLAGRVDTVFIIERGRKPRLQARETIEIRTSPRSIAQDSSMYHRHPKTPNMHGTLHSHSYHLFRASVSLFLMEIHRLPFGRIFQRCTSTNTAPHNNSTNVFYIPFPYVWVRSFVCVVDSRVFCTHVHDRLRRPKTTLCMSMTAQTQS